MIKLVRQRSYWRRIGEYVQRHVCFDNIQSSLKENVIFSVCALCGQCRIHHIYHMEFHFWFNIISGVAVRVKGHQQKNQVIFKEGGQKKFLEGRANF